MRLFFLSLAFIFFTGCGYKPTSSYIKNSIGDSVYVFVEIFPSDPENSVVIKDAINEAVITKFRSKLASINEAKTQMRIRIGSLSMNPIQYDSNGYVVLYRMNLVLDGEITKQNSKNVERVSGNGSYDFSVEPGSSLSEEKRYQAIHNSSMKAIDMLISQISIRGIVNNDARSNNK